MAKKQNPIGFTKPKSMPREAESYLTGNGDEEEADQQADKLARLPKVVPVYVGQIEALEILATYDIFPLAPLSNVEQQLLQVVAALEQELASQKHE